MAPNIDTTELPPIDATGVLNEKEYLATDDGPEPILKNPEDRKLQLVWRNIILFAYLHIGALYGVYLIFTSAKLATTLFTYILYAAGCLGITAGVHRLWAHRAYKANLPLRIILIALNTIAFEDSVFHWARDHRVHHKFTETEADPHNSKRGFFFSHCGWLLCKKRPEVIEKGKQMDVADLLADPVVMFQHKYYSILMPLVCFILPTIAPVVFWGETWVNSWHVATLFRYSMVLNATWLVNSAAHVKTWGYRPYDKNIHPTQNLGIAIYAFGEGWHNYHHTFPWDYKASELGAYGTNLTTAFLDFFAKIGWAYDLKTASPDMIKKRVERTGDGSHEIWGWGDKDQTQEDIDGAIIIRPKIS